MYSCKNTLYLQVLFSTVNRRALDRKRKSTFGSHLGMFRFPKCVENKILIAIALSIASPSLPGNRSSGTDLVQYFYISSFCFCPCYVHHDRAEEKALRQDHIYRLKRLVVYVMDMNLFSVLFKASMYNLLPSPAAGWCQWLRWPVCAWCGWGDWNLYSILYYSFCWVFLLTCVFIELNMCLLRN